MWRGILWLSAVESLEIHKKLSFDRIPSSATTNLCLKCIERSIESVECLEGCRFVRYCFTKSIHFVCSPPVVRRQKKLYYVVIRLVIRFFGYYVSEQYELSTVSVHLRELQRNIAPMEKRETASS